MRCITDYPPSRSLVETPPSPLRMTQNHQWPVPELLHHVHEHKGVGRALNRSHRLRPSPLHPQLIRELVPLWLGLNSSRTRSQMDSYEKTAVLSRYVLHEGTTRLTTAVQELVWLGFPDDEAHTIIAAYGGCRSAAECGQSSGWCGPCSIMLTEMSQVMNVRAGVRCMMKWLTTWSEDLSLKTSGHHGPIHRCGAACPYRRALPLPANDTWSLLNVSRL